MVWLSAWEQLLESWSYFLPYTSVLAFTVGLNACLSMPNLVFILAKKKTKKHHIHFKVAREVRIREEIVLSSLPSFSNSSLMQSQVNTRAGRRGGMKACTGKNRWGKERVGIFLPAFWFQLAIRLARTTLCNEHLYNSGNGILVLGWLKFFLYCKR